MSVRVHISSWTDRRTPDLKARGHVIAEQQAAWHWERRFRAGVLRRIAERMTRRLERAEPISIFHRQQAS